MKEANLSRYLPSVVREAKEMQELVRAENPTLTTLWNDTDNVEQDQFVYDATVNGLRRWEKMLDIAPKATESLEERRTRIITRLNEQPPYTVRVLGQWLALAYGEGHYSVDLKHEEYILNVGLLNVNDNAYTDVFAMLCRIVPANLIIKMLVQKEYDEFTPRVSLIGDTIGSISDTKLPRLQEEEGEHTGKVHLGACFGIITQTPLPALNFD